MVDVTHHIGLLKDGLSCLGREPGVLPRVDELSLARLEGLCHFSHVFRLRSKFLKLFAIFESHESRACLIHFIVCVLL